MEEDKKELGQRLWDLFSEVATELGDPAAADAEWGKLSMESYPLLREVELRLIAQGWKPPTTKD